MHTPAPTSPKNPETALKPPSRPFFSKPLGAPQPSSRAQRSHIGELSPFTSCSGNVTELLPSSSAETGFVRRGNGPDTSIILGTHRHRRPATRTPVGTVDNERAARSDEDATPTPSSPRGDRRGGRVSPTPATAPRRRSAAASSRWRAYGSTRRRVRGSRGGPGRSCRGRRVRCRRRAGRATGGTRTAGAPRRCRGAGTRGRGDPG